MYIKEAQKCKDELEEEIKGLVLKFEEEVKMSITDLRIRRIETTAMSSEYKDSIPVVELRVELRSKNC